jgi:hypothetical protein
MENAETVDQVEGVWPKRQLEDACLDGGEVLVLSKVRASGVHCVAQVDADDPAAPAKDDVGEATHAATDIEHEPPADVIGRPACPFSEGAL